MKPLNATILAAIHEQRATLVPFVRKMVKPEARDTYTDEALEQMLGGFLALLTEALEEREPETRTFVIETVFPGLVAQGEDIWMISSGVVSFGISLTVRALESIPAADRPAATEWLAEFFGGYVADLTRAGVEAGRAS